MRATFAELRWFAAGRNRLRASILVQDTFYAIDTEFAEAENGIILGLDMQIGGAQGRGEPRVVFFDDDAAIDGGGEGADRRQWEWIRHAKLQNAGIGCGFANVVVADASGDDAEGGAVLVDTVWSLRVVPCFHLGHLGAEPAVGGFGVAGNHDATGDVADEIGGGSAGFGYGGFYAGSEARFDG